MKKTTAMIYVMLVNGKLEYHLTPFGSELPGKIVGKLSVAEYSKNERYYQDHFNEQLQKGAYANLESK